MFQVEEMLLAKVLTPVVLFTLRPHFTTQLTGLGGTHQTLCSENVQSVWLCLSAPSGAFVFPPTHVQRLLSP